MSDTSVHIAVLPTETLEYLRAKQGGRFLDCTMGGGGHTRAILDSNPNNIVVAIDRDSRAISRAEKWKGKYGTRLEFHKAKFSELDTLGANNFNGILADLGISSDQLAENRGFSFNDEGPLDMRMDEEEGLSAARLVETAGEKELMRLLKRGGLKQGANAVARAIVRERPFHSAAHFSECVRTALKPFRTKEHLHPATLVFQAIRMEVNAEMEELEALLASAPKFICDGGRLVIISFQSLEDQLVTNIMRRWQSGGEFSASMPGNKREKPLGKLLTGKAVTPKDEEVENNPRARSARMRVFEFGDIGKEVVKEG